MWYNKSMEKPKCKLLLEPLLYEGQTIIFQDKEYFVRSLNIITNGLDVTLSEVKRQNKD